MPEQEYEVQVYDVEYLCDECEEPMKCKALVAHGHDRLRHLHVCKNGHETLLDTKYPLTRHWRIDG